MDPHEELVEKVRRLVEGAQVDGELNRQYAASDAARSILSLVAEALGEPTDEAVGRASFYFDCGHEWARKSWIEMLSASPLYPQGEKG